MGQNFKVFIALIFITVLGWVLLQPVFDAVEVGPSPPPVSDSAPDAPTPPEAAESPEPDDDDHEPEALPEAFRTEALFRSYPAGCLRPGPAGSGVIAVARSNDTAAGTLGDALEEFPGRLGSVGLHGEVSLHRGKQGMAVSDLDADVVTPVFFARELVWSPVSRCGLAIAIGRSTLMVLPHRQPLVRADVREAAFSPDGRRLALVLKEPQTKSLWVARLAGGRMQEVLREPPDSSLELRGWSPDGRTFYFTRRSGGLSFVTAGDPPQGGRLTTEAVEELEQCGDRLLAVSSGAIVEVGTTGLDELTSRTEQYRYISCSPDGSFIAAIGSQGLVLLDRNGALLRDLTQDSGYTDVFVDWGRQGAGLIFGRVRAGGDPKAAELWFIPEGGSPRPTGITYRPGPNAVDWAASPPTGLP